MQAVQRPDMFNMEMSSISRLGEAQRRIGGVETLARIWPFWQGFAQGPLNALFGQMEARMAGQEVDLAMILSLGSEPSPTRPKLGMRQAVGVILALQRLEKLTDEDVLDADLVAGLFQNIDAPQLSRSMNLGLAAVSAPPGSNMPGSNYWSMPPRLIEAGLPPLWAAGITLALWEREGPEHPNRSMAGRVLMAGLAMRLGLPYQAFCYLGPLSGSGGQQAAGRTERRGAGFAH